MMMSSDRAILPLRMLFVMIVASTLAIGIFVWQMMGALQELDEVGQMHQKMASLSNGALYQHESMTAAAQMLAMNSRPEWKVQYETARAQLKTTFADIGRLLPGPLLEVNEDIDASSDRLAEIEQASFLLAGAGYPMEGLDLLGGPEYVRLKGHFRQELVALGENLETQSKKQEEDLREELLWRGVVLGGIMAGLVAMWLVCLRLLVRWQKGMLTAQRGREQAEAQLVRQEHVLDRIIDNLPVGLFAKNVAQGYRWDIFNRKAEELFELSGATLRGTTDFEHFPDHEARFFRQIDEKVMAEGRVMDVEEEEVTTARGTWLAHTIKVPIYDEDGQPSLLLGIIEDITVRKQQANLKLQADAAELEQKNTELEEARARAEAADSAKTQFLATMSHEIRTPLNGVIGTADLLSRTELSGRQEDYVRTVQKSAETLLYVINDILDLTKLEARQLSLERLSFDLSRTVEDVIEIHGANASKKDLDLLMRYAPGTPERVFADPGRLRQI